MATFKSIEDIEAWQLARDLTREIYQVSGRGAFSRDYALRDQVRRACISVMSNIAEGFERNGTGEFLQFLAIAKGSIGELRSQMYIAFDQQYIDKAAFDRLSVTTSKIGNMIGGLMDYLRKTPIKGTKYK